MTRRKLIQHLVNGYDRCATAATKARLWWQRWWLWTLGVPLVAGVFIVIQVMWKIAGQPVPGISDLFTQMQMVISGTQAVIALVVGLTVMYSARTAAEGVRDSRRRALDEAHRARVRRAVAFVGAAVDVAAYGGTLATIQREGVSGFSLPVRGEDDLRLATWQQLTAATSAAARALQEIRFAEDEVLDTAEELFVVVRDVVQIAAEGDLEGVETRAGLVREGSDKLLMQTKALSPDEDEGSGYVRPSA